MFNLMKENHKTFNNLNNLKPRKTANKKKIRCFNPSWLYL